MLFERGFASKKWVNGPIFSFLRDCFFSEKFELLGRFGCIHQFPAPEDLHHSKLFIGDAHYPDMAFRRQDGFYSFCMYLGILPATAMPYIHAELEHGEPVCHDLLPEQCIVFPVLFGFGRKVKMY